MHDGRGGLEYIPLPERLSIGRSSSCGLTLPDASVSAKHAEILTQNDGEVLLCDLGSTNGTTLDGEPVRAGATTHLRLNSCLRFGFLKQDFVLCLQNPSKPMIKPPEVRDCSVLTS